MNLGLMSDDLPDPRGVEAAIVNEGAVFDEVREDGAHGAVVAGGLEGGRARCNYCYLLSLVKYLMYLSKYMFSHRSPILHGPCLTRVPLAAQSSCEAMAFVTANDAVF